MSENLLYLLISPKQSEATFLWYIYLLFFLYALYLLCIKGFRIFKQYFEFALLAVGLYFYFYPVATQILCLDYFTEYLLFYSSGLIAARHFYRLREHIGWLKVIGFICLISFIILTVIVFIHPRPSVYVMLCFVSIPAMYGLSNVFGRISWVRNVLVTISKNCFHIYLVHMFFVQAIALVFVKIYGGNIESQGAMLLYLALSITVSIVGSIVFFRLFDKTIHLISK